MATFTNPRTISTDPSVSILSSNCVLWLDASDTSNFFQLSTNTSPGYSTPVININDPIGYWIDKSGYDHHFGVITPTNRPVLGLSSVYFDGVSTRWLECIDEIGEIYSFRTDSTNPLSGLTYFIVSEAALNTGTSVLFTQITGTTARAFDSGNLNSPILRRNGQAFEVFAFGGTGNRRSHNLEPDYLTTLEMRRNIITTVYTYNNLTQLFVNGEPQNSNGAGAHWGPNPVTIKRARIGADLNSFTAPTQTYIGHIREVIIYNIPLTFQQQKYVEAYLGEKWKAAYVTYPNIDGNFETPTVWFNDTVPQLSTATVIANGFTVNVNNSGTYPRFQNKSYTRWGWTDPGIRKSGTYNINGNVTIQTEYVLQDIPYGRHGEVNSSGQSGTGYDNSALSPVITIPSGSTLTLSAQRIQCLSYGGNDQANSIPALLSNSGNVVLNVPLLYAHSTSPVFRGNGGTLTVNNGRLASSARTSSVATISGPIFALTNNAISTFNTCQLLVTRSTLASDDSLRAANGITHVSLLNSTGVFNDCNINSYGRSGGSVTSESTGAGVYINSTGSALGIFNRCFIQGTVSVDSTSTVGDKMGVYINGVGARSFFDSCTIRGSNFNTASPNSSNVHAGIYVNNAVATITNSSLFGGDGDGTFSTSTQRFDQLNTYPSGLRVTGGTATVTLTSCSIYGNITRKGQGIHINSSGTVNTEDCRFYAGVDSNAVNGTPTTLNISGPVIEDSSTGFRAIACPRYFTNPIPKNAYIRYATDGTGIGFNAFTYHYTIDSLSAFSMPDVSAVRIGTPYAGGLLVGTAVIPPAAAVSYGTLVDNTTGSAILTLDLLNTLFTTPLSALTTPNTIGYRVANSVASNQSIGHLIASFTTN